MVFAKPCHNMTCYVHSWDLLSTTDYCVDQAFCYCCPAFWTCKQSFGLWVKVAVNFQFWYWFWVWTKKLVWVVQYFKTTPLQILKSTEVFDFPSGILNTTSLPKRSKSHLKFCSKKSATKIKSIIYTRILNNAMTKVFFNFYCLTLI